MTSIGILPRSRTTSLRVASLLALAVTAALSAATQAAPTSATVSTASRASASLIGVVRDSLTGAPLPHASVVVAAVKRGAVADTTGRFALGDLPVGTVHVKAVLVGYQTAALDVVLAAGETRTIDVALARAPILQPPLGVRDTRLSRRETPSVFALEPRAVKQTAGTLENVFRTVATYPGVISTTDFTSRISVRGGGPDQNLVLLDDVEIYNPYRVFGLVSAFNPEIVSDFTLSGGGFPVKYGNRLSALLLVTNRDGSPAKQPGAAASMSLTDANVVLEGPLPRALGGEAEGTWLLTSRRTYYDFIADAITHTQLPSFLDFQGKLALNLTPRDRLSVFGLLSHERTNATVTDNGPVDRAHFFDTARNDVGGATWLATRGRTVNRLTASYYKNTDVLSFNGEFNADSRIANVPGGDKQAHVILDRTILVRDATLREDLGCHLGDHHLISLGGEIHAQRTDLQYQLDPESDRNPRVGNPTDVRGGSAAPDTFLTKRPSTRGALYVQDEWSPFERLRVTAGLRGDYSTVNRESDLSARTSTSYLGPAGVTLRGAIGMFTQTPGYEKFLDEDYFIRLDQPGPLDVTNERATHYILSAERPLGTAWRAQLEGYVKRFDDLIVGRLETEEERRFRLSRYANFPFDLRSEIPQEPQITAFPVNGASGTARGCDLYLVRTQQGPEDLFWGWLSYTFGVANRHAYGRTIPFDYDRRHTLNVVANLRLGTRWELGVTGHYGSGFPYDPATGVTVSTIVDSLGHIVPERDSVGNIVWQPKFDGVTGLGTKRLPSFQEIELRVTYTPTWFAKRWSIYVDVINALNRKNLVEISPYLEYDPSADRPSLHEESLRNFPLLPTLGITVRW
jgi:hypothetical protein